MYGICGWGGGLAEYIAVDVKYIHVLPKGVSFAWHAIKRSGFTQGKNVLILGAGPVLRSFDTSNVIIVSEPTSLRREQAIKHGATFSFNPLETDIPKAVLEATGGIGADIAFDAAGIQASLDAALQSVRPRGTVLNIAIWEKPARSASYDRVHPELLEAIGSGKIPGLEDLITSKISIDDVVEKGFHALLNNKDAQGLS
ncbi:hypothetical protein DXG01_009438 [Tephrocybe rancida]|nr:hypothetical protein DXG01_009438 [Tephrocybe rancida]